MALLDWLTYAPFGNNSTAPNDVPKNKKYESAGADVINGIGMVQDAANGKGDFGPGGTFMDSSEIAKKNVTMGFWASLLGGK